MLEICIEFDQRDVTSQSTKHKGINRSAEHVTFHTQWGYGNFSPYTKTLEHNSYDCYEDNRFGTRNGHNDRSYNRVSRNEVSKGGNYVKLDERFHKRREDVERYHDRYDLMSMAIVVRTCTMSIMIVIAMEGLVVEEVLEILERYQDLLVTKNFKLPLLWGTFCPYDYVPREQEVESLFYSYGVREEEKIQLVLNSLLCGQ
ncbi:hypothetical protein M9H77_23247 [Catharanthus roseus]|uniref:Uncharacterized protein n=1 Tax=Catharanthus roseus TaxID=4058 RepID=A0ACC0ASS7_CATRO|nr:hypothetical protein M9H77_23247 [Catharanthus roseus]